MANDIAFLFGVALEALLLDRLDPRREAGVQVREAVRLINAKCGRVQVRWLADQVNECQSARTQLQAACRSRPQVAARQTRASAVAREVKKVRRTDWALHSVLPSA